MGRVLVLLGLMAACGADAPSTPTWHLVDPNEPAALLSIWGTDANDVWVVGGRTTLTGGPTVLHYSNHAWSRVETGQSSLDLWWVIGFPGGDVFFGGSGGTILRYHDSVFEKMTTPRTGTIFGIWGATQNDLWAVGDGGAAGGIVWHYDGSTWTEPTLPPGVPSRVFKVHGQASDNVWMSCSDGSTLHWQGSAFERQPTGVVSPLFSIVTTPDQVFAVGGTQGQGAIVEHTAAGWATASLDVPVAWRGAAVRDSSVFAVGEAGLVAQEQAGAWTVVPQTLTQGNFHAAWIDPAGSLWAVGGSFDQTPLTAAGFLAYYGPDTIGTISP